MVGLLTLNAALNIALAAGQVLTDVPRTRVAFQSYLSARSWQLSIAAIAISAGTVASAIAAVSLFLQFDGSTIATLICAFGALWLGAATDEKVSPPLLELLEARLAIKKYSQQLAKVPAWARDVRRPGKWRFTVAILLESAGYAVAIGVAANIARLTKPGHRNSGSTHSVILVVAAYGLLLALIMLVGFCVSYMFRSNRQVQERTRGQRLVSLMLPLLLTFATILGVLSIIATPGSSVFAAVLEVVILILIPIAFRFHLRTSQRKPRFRAVYAVYTWANLTEYYRTRIHEQQNRAVRPRHSA